MQSTLTIQYWTSRLIQEVQALRPANRGVAKKALQAPIQMLQVGVLEAASTDFRTLGYGRISDMIETEIGGEKGLESWSNGDWGLQLAGITGDSVKAVQICIEELHEAIDDYLVGSASKMAYLILTGRVYQILCRLEGFLDHSDGVDGNEYTPVGAFASQGPSTSNLVLSREEQEELLLNEYEDPFS